MIVSKISGGLGNQMFQYAIARYLSIKNETALYLDIAGFRHDKLRHYELGAFDLDCKVVNDFKVPLLNKLGNRLGIKKIQFDFYEDKVWDFDEKLYTSTGKYIHLSGYWAWPSYFKSIDKIIRNDFRLKTPMQFICKKWIDLVERKNSVSLHIRRSDYVSDKHAAGFFGALDLTYYQSAIAYIYEHVDHPHFFIFSDDLTWAREHFIPVSRIENYSIVEDPFFTNPARELILMSYCKHNIIANSTFSWWAAWLNTNDGKIVIQPETWYADKAAQQVYQKGFLDIKNCIKF